VTMRRSAYSFRWSPAVVAALAVFAVAGFAQAQPKAPPPSQSSSQSPAPPSGPPNALQGFSQNRDQPVKIDAAALEVRERNRVATFTGNVRLVQGDTTLRCKTLVVFYDQDDASGPAVKAATPGPTGSQQIRRMEAKGGVMVTQKDQTATGDSAIYDMKSDTVTLFAPTGGAVAVTQGPNVMKGERLVVNLGSGISHLEGRVTGLIIPNAMKNEGHAPPDAKTPPHPAPNQPPKPHTNPAGLY
jgi:lipopolysaccharide export system protein LptA